MFLSLFFKSLHKQKVNFYLFKKVLENKIFCEIALVV